MQNKSINKPKRFLTVALAGLILISTAAASIMSGCGENSESSGETKAAKETEVVTEIVDVTYATDSNGNTVPAKNSESSANKKTNNEKSENSSSKGSDNSSSANKEGSSKSNDNSSSTAKNNNSSSAVTNKPVTDSNACEIDGKKFAVGDTVTCVYKLKAPENLENYQATITYDTKYLSVQKATLEGPAKSGGMINYKNKGKILFNGINISTGYDYKKADKFVSVTYKVEAKGKTNPSFTWQVATGLSKTSASGKAYVKDNKAVDGLTLTKEYS